MCLTLTKFIIVVGLVTIFTTTIKTTTTTSQGSSSPLTFNIGIVLSEEQKGGSIDKGYRWALKYLNAIANLNKDKNNAYHASNIISANSSTRKLLFASNFLLNAETLYVKPGNSYETSKSICTFLQNQRVGFVALFGASSKHNPGLEWKLTWISGRMEVPLIFPTPLYPPQAPLIHGESANMGWAPAVVDDDLDESSGGESFSNNSFTSPPAFFDPFVPLRLSPPESLWGDMLRDLATYLGLEQVAILYEDVKGFKRAEALLSSPSPVAHLVVKKIINREGYRTVLADVKGRDYTHLIIDCHVSSLGPLLKAIDELHMTDYKYHYIFTNPDLRTVDMSPYIRANVNLTSFQIVNPESKVVQERVWEMRCLDVEVNATLSRYFSDVVPTKTALAFDSVMTLSLALSGMMGASALRPSGSLSCDEEDKGGGKWKDGPSLLNYITATEFKGLSGPISFTKGGERSNFKVDITRLTADGWRKVGFWSTESGLNVTRPKVLWDQGLTNTTLVVTCVLEPPYVQMRQGSNLTGNARFEGFSVDLLKMIASVVGFSYILETVPDGKYGAYDGETGEWNGVIRQLADKSVDLGIGALTITYTRELVVDFTKPFMHFGISILYRKPIQVKTGIFAFFKPLDLEVWLGVAVSYLLVSLTMYIVARFSPYEWPTSTTTTASLPIYDDGAGVGLVERNQFTISNALWYPIGTLMRQVSDLNPKAMSTRIVGGSWWLFGVIMVASYTANLAAFLTQQRLTNPIGSEKDLLEQSEVSYGSLESGSTMSYFKHSKIETYQKMWRIMESRKPSVFTSSYGEAVNRVLRENGKYAFLMESTTVSYVMAQNCNLTQIGGLLNSKGYGIALPKGSPWKDKISLAILELQEIGVIRWYQDKWWSKKPDSALNNDDQYCSTEFRNSQEKSATTSALGVDNIGGVFVIITAGLGIAIVVAVAEFLRTSGANAEVKGVPLCAEIAHEVKTAICTDQGTRKLKKKKKQRGRKQSIRKKKSGKQRLLLSSPISSPAFLEDDEEIPTPPPPPTPRVLCPAHCHNRKCGRVPMEMDNSGANNGDMMNIFSPAYEEQSGSLFGIRHGGCSNCGGSDTKI